MLPFSRILNYGNDLNNVVLDGIYNQIGTYSNGTFDFGYSFRGNDIYVFGGVLSGASVSRACFYFNADTPGTVVPLTSTPKMLFGFGCSTYGNKFYAFAGTTRNTPTGSNIANTSCYYYDRSTNTWVTITPTNAPTTGGYSKMVTVGNYLYLYGLGASNQLYRYDPELNSFTALSSSATTGTPWGLCTDGQYLYTSKVNTIERYDISNNTWSTLQSSTGVSGNIMYLNGYLYIQDTNKFARYKISTNTLEIITTTIPYTRGALLTHNNKVYSIMGYNSTAGAPSNLIFEVR